MLRSVWLTVHMNIDDLKKPDNVSHSSKNSPFAVGQFSSWTAMYIVGIFDSHQPN